MANDVETYVREILDNVQVIEATRKAAQEEKILAKVREASGTAGVKAYKQVQAEAAKAAKEAERAAKEAERAAKGPSAWTQALQANTEAVKDSSKELNDFRGKVNQSAESLGKIGAALGAISPELGSVVTTAQQGIGAVSGLSGAMGTLGAALPPIAIAGGLVAAGFYDLEQQNKALREESDRLTKQLDKLKDGLEGIRDVEAELLQRELTLADPNAAKHLEASTKAAEKYAPQVAVVKEELGRAREEQRKANAELERWTTGLDAQTMAQDVVTRHQRDAQKALDDATASVTAQEAQLQALNEAQGSLAGRLITVTVREEEAKEAKERTKEAEKDATEAARERERVQAMLLKALLAEADAETKRSETLQEAKASLEDMKRSSEEALATDEERIALAAQAAREAAVAAANEAQAASNSAEERKRIAKDLSETLININVDEARQFKAIEDEKTKKAKEAAEERAQVTKDALTDAYDEVLGSTNTFLDQLASNQSSSISALQDAIETAEEKGQTAKAASLKKNLEAEQEGARKVFALQQSLKYADATMSYAQALMTAAALPPPADVIKGVAATAAYGLSIATISSQDPPTFSDTPAGGYRFTSEDNTIRGASNDTAILFRDPLEGFQQALDVLARRQAPTSTPARERRPLLGKQLATTPVARLLTRDAERLTRGRL